MITLDPRMFTMEIVAIKSHILVIVVLKKDDIYLEILLIDQDLAILLQIVGMGFDIYCFETIVSVVKLIIHANLLYLV